MSSSRPNEQTVSLVRDLVGALTNFQDRPDVFSHCENYVLSQFAHSDSMTFVNRKEIDGIVSGLAEKFRFHGFAAQADELVTLYAAFVPDGLPKPQLEDRLVAVKFLVYMSESPTRRFLESPAARPPVAVEERIDWGVYLKEGIERWSPSYTSSSDSCTDECEEASIDKSQQEVAGYNNFGSVPKVTANDDTPNEGQYVNREELSQKLTESVQSGWWNAKEFQQIPESTNIDARIAFHWDEFVEHTTYGLLAQKSTIISEYKVMREVIWQLFSRHTSVCFTLERGVLHPNENVSISSVRAPAFKSFLTEFLLYINTMQFFRDFHNSLWKNSEIFHAPGMYFSYEQGLQQIIDLFYDRVIILEAEIVKQKNIMTLLKMSQRLRDIFEDVAILKRIHDEVVLDFKVNRPVICATTLLSRLHYGLLNSAVSKKELDIYLTLYLSALYRYLQLINSWFNNDWLVDLYNEFIIVNRSSDSVTESTTDILNGCHSMENVLKGRVDYKSICLYDETSDSENETSDNPLRFVVRDLEGLAASDAILQIIATDIVQIGKNIRHLRMLGRLYLLKCNQNDTLYEEFTAKLLNRISTYFGNQEGEVVEPPLDSNPQVSYKFPAMCQDYVKYPTNMDRLENLVDTSDGFLMKAFESFFVEQPKVESSNRKKKCLYERISETTKSLFPIKQMVEEVFVEVFEGRYATSGHTVKNLLYEEHKIKEHLELLQYVFLFKDNLLSPWYLRLFEQMEKGVHVDNDAWLTGFLYDNLIDTFPHLYEHCTVKASDMWNLYKDPLKVCGLVMIEYSVKWPISMIIKKDQLEMYKRVFQFVLQVKWALFTLNRMYFDKIEPNVRISKQHQAVTIILRKLKVSRFWLINEFSAIQHYTLGTLCVNASMKFQTNLSNTSNLDALIVSHDNFVNDIHSAVIRLQYYNQMPYGFNQLLHLVDKLRCMWNDLKSVEDQELVKLEKSYRMCHANLEAVMHPKNTWE